MMMPRILKEPLLHFLLIAGAIFAAYMLVNGEGWNTNRITITASKINQMTEVFVKTKQRPPSADEVKAMIDDYVKEELYVRQALELGLDQDDTIIRRRLRQKMEFLGNAEAESMVPTEAELQAYLDSHLQRFEIEPQIAMEQVFLSSERDAETLAADAATLLAALESNPDTDVSTIGDPTMLPPGLPLTRLAGVADTYGPEVSEAAGRAPLGQWIGPVQSGFGYHLIRVTDRRPGRIPALANVRDEVRAELIQARRAEVEDRRLADMLKRFEVVIEPTNNTAGAKP